MSGNDNIDERGEKIMALWNEDIEDVVICNEYELHNIVSKLSKLPFDCNVDDDENDIVVDIELETSGRLNEDDRQILEDEVSGLLKHIRHVDCKIHEIAEYACR